MEIGDLREKEIMKESASTPKRAPAKDVDTYLASAPKELRAVLENLREAIKAAAPKAEEVISYQIPTYKYHGPLVHFVARESYCSFIAVSKTVLEKFKTASASIQFPLDKPLPLTLIRKITAFRVKECLEQDAKWRT
jgi:uncharacterized protein YdhG (YjbR/CyaY superfamily)